MDNKWSCLQEDLRKAIMASIQEVDPGNPWIKDASGRHTNVMALLEWPLEDSDDSDTEVSIAALREYGAFIYLVAVDFEGQILP